MNVYEAATARRTVRKFQQRQIPRKDLERYIDAARLAPSGSNMQPIKYAIVDDPAKVAGVFEKVKWASYIAPAGNPGPDERPTAFVVVLADTKIKGAGYEIDAGSAIQTLLLSAWEDGVGSCWMANIDKAGIASFLGLGDQYVVVAALALGYKAEDPVVEPLTDSVKYWKDKSGRLHVPKRSLDEVIVKV